MKEYTRTKALPAGHRSETAGWSGALELLFRRFPELRKIADLYILKLKPNMVIHETRLKLKSLQKRIHDKCLELGLNEADSYPLNTDTVAHRALSEYVKRVMTKRSRRFVEANRGKQALATFQTGDGTGKPVLKPFERIEGDAHKIDGRWEINIPSIFGNIVSKVVYRIWDIVLRDPTTDVVLSHSVCYHKEPTSEDFLFAVHKAMTPWRKPELRIPTLKFYDGAGYPSNVDARFIGAKFGGISVDGALSETCNKVQSRLKEVAGCTTFVIHRRNPNDREVEGYFASLEENGFHRLPNTTGTGPNDPRRDQPDQKALKYHMQLEDLIELLEVMHANHNATRSTGLGGRTPLEVLKHQCESRNYWPEQASPEKVVKLLISRVVVRVCGDIKEARHPYVNFAGARYSSRAIRGQFGLIGKYLSLELSPDIRTVRAFDEKGAELGVLMAAPPWNRTPHDLEMRRAILKVQREGRMRQYLGNSDPVLDYLRYLEDVAKEGKAIPPAYVRVRSYLASYLPPAIEDLHADLDAPTPDQPHKISGIGSDFSPKSVSDLSRLKRMAINGRLQ
jgi:hypothetical protein